MKRRPFLSGKACLKVEETEPYEIKFMRAAMNIRDVFPFLYAALSVIPRYYSEETAAGISVSGTSVWIKPSYLEKASEAELTGMLIHEMFHILMGHVLRGTGKDPEKWNLACDFYVNCCIYGIFGILPGQGPVRLVSNRRRVEATLPDWMPFDPETDMQRDTPEDLYKRICAQERKIEANTGTGDTGVPAEKRGRQGDRGESEEGVRSGEGETSPLEAAISENGQSEVEDALETVSQRQDTERLLDLADDQMEGGVLASEGDDLERQVYTIQRIYKEQCVSSGRGTSYEEAALPLLGLKQPQKIDWRRIVESRLAKVRSGEKSLSHPDRRFVYRGIYLEGDIPDENHINGIKICIDTSASMTEDDMERALHHTELLLKEYSLSAELIFWDEEIERAEPFEDAHQLKRISRKVWGRGGTNPECLFEYFDSRERPELILIFTDGLFSFSPGSDVCKKYGNDTFWILAGSHSMTVDNFKPGFGTVIRGDQ